MNIRRLLAITRIVEIALIAGALMFGTAASAQVLPPLVQPPPPAGTQWQQTHIDGFGYGGLNPDRWMVWTGTHGAEPQAYVNTAHAVAVKHGFLYLTADAVPALGLQFSSGEVRSTWTQQYGLWCVCCKLPPSLWCWPAIWLRDSNKAKYDEIDVLERFGSIDQFTNWITATANVNRKTILPRTSLDFIWYIADWRPGSITWYTCTASGLTQRFYTTQGVPQVPMFLILNNALHSGATAAGLNGPQSLIVSDVRIFTAQ